VARFRSLIYLLPQLWRAFFRRPITLRYPFEPLSLPSYYRGRVVAEENLCRGCGLCASDCPAAALELERESRDRFTLIYHPDRCVYCGQCEMTCRFGAIRLTNAFEDATPDRDTLVHVLVERGEDTHDRPSD